MDYFEKTGFGIGYVEQVWSSLMHRHITDELVIIEKGKSTILTNERIYKASGTYAIFYPRDIYHEQKNDMGVDYSRYCINYDRDGFGGILKKLSPASFFVIPLYPDELPRVERWVVPLYECHMAGADPTDPIDNGRIGYLLALILNELAPLIRERAKDYVAVDCAAYIHDVCFYISEHCAEPLSLDTLAERFFISRSTLVRGFNSAFGISPGKYITTTRIEKSKYLLHEGASVSEASLACGFTTPSYFIKVFTGMVGVTPKKYRDGRS